MTFEILWTPAALEQLEYWRKNDLKKVQKIKLLCQAIEVYPESGLGKPERLKFFKGNVWSRRIDQEHRLVYEVRSNNIVFILQCRYHY
ncbi:Txe/YoeB family addiction module toxin [Candidatus Trichorickettsia mobilis]|uniref:Txe/YoeB family addiction module toxin n=1 Tax=Candidatus Trichorickettsia mobilis TaxID=1346319 RepID=UPI002931BA1E|nr:Txe/YoeB family addiction module toxin [Candidatus Trichorickettsia mobilis]